MYIMYIVGKSKKALITTIQMVTDLDFYVEWPQNNVIDDIEITGKMF